MSRLFEDLRFGEYFISKCCLFTKTGVREARFLYADRMSMEPTTPVRKITFAPVEEAKPYDYVEVRGLLFVLMDNGLLGELCSEGGPYAVPDIARKVVLENV